MSPRENQEEPSRGVIQLKSLLLLNLGNDNLNFPIGTWSGCASWTVTGEIDLTMSDLTIGGFRGGAEGAAAALFF